MIPLTILGGYLGAGKTTLINRLLHETQDKRLTILVNDFGAINIDARLIRVHKGDTIELTNGCACCQLQDNMTAQLVDIAQSPHPPDYILVEASGISEPARLLLLGHGIAAICPGTILIAADACDITKKYTDKFVGKLVRRQIEQADIILLTKSDMAHDGGAQSISWLTRTSKAPIFDVHRADLSALCFTPFPKEHIDAPAALPIAFETLHFRHAQPLAYEMIISVLDRFHGKLARAKGSCGTHFLQLVGTHYQLTPIDTAETELIFIAPRYMCDMTQLKAALDDLT